MRRQKSGSDRRSDTSVFPAARRLNHCLDRAVLFRGGPVALRPQYHKPAAKGAEAVFLLIQFADAAAEELFCRCASFETLHVFPDAALNAHIRELSRQGDCPLPTRALQAAS